MSIPFPITQNASDDLQITIHLHEFYLGDRQRKCWTYITKGMTRFGQQEMMLSLILEDDDSEAYPTTPIKMFSLLADYAQQGRIVTSGEATKLGKTGLFGFTVLFYLPAIQYPTLPAAENHIALVLIHQEEYDFAKRFGLARLISRISKLCSCLPYPTWNTRRRPSLFPQGHDEKSLLSGGYSLPNLSQAMICADQLEISITPEHQRQLVNLHSGDELTFLVMPSDKSDAVLHWQDGTTGAVSLGATPHLLGLSFVQFSVGKTANLNLSEDGAIVSITENDIRLISLMTKHQQINPYISVFFDVKSDEACIPYQFGAAWITPKLGDDIQLDRISGNNLLEKIRSSATEQQNVVALANQIQDTLAAVMSEETDSFHMQLRIERDNFTINGDIEFNPDFVQFLKENLHTIDFSPLDNASATLFFTINPQT